MILGQLLAVLVKSIATPVINTYGKKYCNIVTIYTEYEKYCNNFNSNFPNMFY